MGTLEKARDLSTLKIISLRDAMNKAWCADNICVYACGSLGRYEITEKSDLDLFFIIMNDDFDNEVTVTNLFKYSFFGKMNELNKNMGFEDPSKGGMYWEFITEKKLLDIGSREEDFNNSFTARMLMILESKPLYNNEKYYNLKKRVIDKYFEDYQDHNTPFFPLYLMNDILRYWYTLTLNYEYRRDSSDDTNKRYWKRLKLKYARFFTCFSMLFCLMKNNLTVEDVLRFSDMTPSERIKYLNDNYNEVKERQLYDKIITQYEWFLDLRKESSEWWNKGDNRSIALEKADVFHSTIKELFAVIANENRELSSRMDIVFIR